MDGLHPFNYGNVIAQAEGIKGARIGNALNQQQLDQNALNLGSDATYGLTPFITKGQDGKVRAYQLSNQGGAQEIQLPQGFDVSGKGTWRDTGGGVQYFEPYGQQPAPTGEQQGISPSIGGNVTIQQPQSSVVQKTLPPEKTPEYIEAIEQTKQKVKLKEAANLKEQEALGAASAKEKVLAKKNKKTFNAYKYGMNRLQSALSKTETGPIMGRIPAVTVEQQSAEGAVAAMSPVLKSLFRESGEGIFTDRDQELLNDMMPKRTDLPETVQFKVDTINGIVAFKLGQTPELPEGWVINENEELIAPTDASGETPTITTQEEFDALPSGTTFIEDGQEYRKP